MKLSLSPKIIGMLAILSAIVGTGIQQTAQAQVPAATAQPSIDLNLAEVLAQSGGEYDDNGQDFDIFLNAVKQTDLVGVLSDKSADFTVFAPTDEAFLKLSRFFGYTGNNEADVIDVINQRFDEFTQAQLDRGRTDPYVYKLRNVIIYHFANGTKSLAELNSLTGDKRLLESLLGDNTPGDNEPEPINYGLAYLDGTIGDSALTMINPKIVPELADIRASNGVIHGIDRVLSADSFDFPPLPSASAVNPDAPATIADVLAQSGDDFDTDNQDFDILNKLLRAVEMTEVLADPNTDLTLFAPTDAAFIKLANRLNGTEAYPDAQPLPEYREARAYDSFINYLYMIDQLTSDLPEGGRGASVVTFLQDALKYHVSAGTQTAAGIQSSTAPISTLLEGATIRYEDGKLVDQSPEFIDPQLQTGKTDITASNGVIQTIDDLLLLQLLPAALQGN